MKSNDWGETQDIGDDKWEDFSTPAPINKPEILSPPPPPPTTSTFKSTTTKTTTNTAAWAQDKSSQSKNDWDSDAFFEDVLASSNKPKLKTTRR